MYIIIDNSSKKYDINFIKYLVHRIQGMYSIRVNYQKLLTYEDYFNSNKCKLFNAEDEPVNITEIVKKIIFGFKLKEYSNRYVLEINPNIYYKNISIALLSDIINNGTLDIKGYPLLKNIVTFVNQHIDDYYIKYKNRL